MFGYIDGNNASIYFYTPSITGYQITLALKGLNLEAGRGPPDIGGTHQSSHS